MTRILPDYLPRRINRYVPAMGYAVDVQHGAPTRYDFGTPAVNGTTDILNAEAITDSASTITTFVTDELDAEYGRSIDVTGGTAGDDADVTLVGRDYWGQPMKETVTLSGTSTVNGAKAFKFLDSVEVAAGNANASSDLSLGFGAELGLPYKTVAVHAELSDDTPEASTGTLTAPVLTDPQTATTGDPRGTYAPNVTLDGSTEVSIFGIADNSVNDDGNGGLLGIAHFYS